MAYSYIAGCGQEVVLYRILLPGCVMARRIRIDLFLSTPHKCPSALILFVSPHPLLPIQPESAETFSLSPLVKPCMFCWSWPLHPSWLLKIELGCVPRSGPVMFSMPVWCPFGHVKFTSLFLPLSLSLSLSLSHTHTHTHTLWRIWLVVIFVYSLKYASAIWNPNIGVYTFTHSVINYPNVWIGTNTRRAVCAESELCLLLVWFSPRGVYKCD